MITETNGYPFSIFNEQDQMMARVNPDRTWSVRWPEVIDLAFRPITKENAVIASLSKVLYAARDNFRIKPWDSPTDDWLYPSTVIQRTTTDYSAERVLFIVQGYGDQYVQVLTKDLTWRVNWTQTLETSLYNDPIWANKQVLGLCDLFMAARDNFHAETLGASF